MNSIRLALVTWNVGGAPSGITPGTETLLRCARNADVIVVGLQEVAVARRGWKTHLRAALGPAWAYAGGESYAGLRLRVFARTRRGLPVVTIISAGMKVGAGFADRWPNKGAIAVEIQFADSCRALFVVAHLAANEKQLVDRQDDWRAILRRLDRDAFLARRTDPAISVPLFHRYEHVFVLGDLNYRIEAPGTDRDDRVHWVQRRVDDRDWPALLARDQLTRERLAGNVFANFQEAVIGFAPTFKIDPGSGKYSTSRVPSYCDRILWHSLPARVPLVRSLRYEPLPEFNHSDHVPVVAEFQLDVPIITPPDRTLSPTRGLRVVLEFMLVRFIKGKTSFLRRTSFADGPTSMRRIQQPALKDAEYVNHDATTAQDHSLQRAARLLDAVGDHDPLSHDLDVLEEEGDDDHTDDEDDDDIDDDGYSTTSSESTDDADDIGLVLDDDADDQGLHPSCMHHGQSHVKGLSSEFSTSAVNGICSLDSSKDYDETLLADMMSRHLSTSSSTDTSTPTATPHGSNPASDERGSADDRGDTGSDTTNSAACKSNMCTPVPLGPALHDARCEIGSAHSQSVPRKRDSLSRQVLERRVQSKRRTRSRLNALRMEVHGHGLFLKRDRVYSIAIPKRRNGQRERIGESLPVIPFVPLSRMEDLQYRHVLIEFARKKSRVGTSGALPLKELLAHCGERYAFEMALTKYGQPVGTLEACVQLTIRDTGCWMDAHDRVVRNHDGGSIKAYRGSLPVRKKTSARTKPNHGKWRGVE